MSDGKKYYCFCSSNCKYETMTKEQILTAIAQAVETGSVGNCDTGFITKVKETNGGDYVTIWVGTKAQYNAIENKQVNCLYIITDDTTSDDVIRSCENAMLKADEAMETATIAMVKADETARAAEPVDFSETNVLETGVIANDPNADISVTEKTFVYSKAAGVVFYSFSVQFTGSMQSGDAFYIKYSFPYAPIDGTTYAVTCDKAQISGWLGEECWDFKVNGDFTDGVARFSGWYFCDNNAAG